MNPKLAKKLKKYLEKHNIETDAEFLLQEIYEDAIIINE